MAVLRILVDENVPGETVRALIKLGHDVVWVRTEAPGSSDQAILQQAQIQNRILITFDKDFGELAFRYGLSASSGIILFRISNASPFRTTALIVTALQSRSEWAGYFSVIEDDRIRMTPLRRSNINRNN